MHSIIVILFCISSAFAYDLDSVSDQYLSAVNHHPALTNIRLNFGPKGPPGLREKRAIQKRLLDDPNNCIANCSKDLEQRLQGGNQTDSDEVRVTKLCTSVQPAEACFNACPKSLFQKLMLDFFPTMTQLCSLGTDNFAELKKIQDCLNRTQHAVISVCSACNSTSIGGQNFKTNAEIRSNPPSITYDDDKKKNSDVLKGICTYLTCESSCGDSIIKEACGQKALDVAKKLTSSVIGSIMNVYKDLDALDGDVKECQNLM